jgi:hypothetical protein
VTHVGLIPVYHRRSLSTYALCDLEDEEMLRSVRWRLHPKGYAVGRTAGSEVLMHRLLLDLPQGDPREGDHENRNKLDNRRCNLRVVSHGSNTQNHPGYGGTSDFRGVHRRKDNGRYTAKVRLHGRLHDLGTFATEIEAARAAEAFRLEHMDGARAELDTQVTDLMSVEKAAA